MAHPLRASRAPSRGQHQQPGKAGSAVFAWESPSSLARQFWPPGVPHTLPPADATLWQCLERSAAAHPHKLAVVFYDSGLRYGELAAQAERLAGFLQHRLGVQPGDRVLLLSQNCPQFPTAFYAVQRADAVVVPANAMSTVDDLEHLLADSGAQVAFAAQELLPRLQPFLDDGRLRSVIVHAYGEALDAPIALPVPDWVRAPMSASVDGERVIAWRDVLAADLVPGSHRARPDDLCVLPYTSGTTGRPKGCRHTHVTVQASNRASAAWRGMSDASVFLAVAPMFHMLGMQNGMNLPLMLGATSVVLPRWDRDVALDLMARCRVSVWGATPAMVIDFFANPQVAERDLSALTMLFGGGAAMPDAVARMLKERYGLTYFEGYGMTETASHLHGSPCQRPKPGCLGIAAIGVDSRIVDPVTLAPLRSGEVGEIVTHAPQVMLGYWNNPQADAEAFIEIDGRRFLRTGDLACTDEDGYFFMRDRLKRMIIVSGYKVWPAEVEDTLYEHPAIHEACAIAAADAKSGEAVKALVVRKPGAALTATELLAWGRERLAAYKAPRVIEFVDALPKSNTGKILWRELQERERARATDHPEETSVHG